MADDPRLPREHSHTVPSAVAFHQHPVHPMLVVYPIAFLSSMVVTDLVFLWRADAFWALLSFWLNVAGLAVGVLAGLVGTADLVLLREVRRRLSAWSHFIAALMTLALAAAGVWLRWPDPIAAVWPWGLLLSALTFAVVMVAGWLGGTLSFRHGIGVYGDRDDERAGAPDDATPPA